MFGKKKLKTDLYQSDDDLDFGDDWSFGDMDAQMNPEATAKTRNPVIDVFKGTMEGGAAQLKSPSFLNTLLKKALPEEYGEITDAASTTIGTVTSLYDEAVREIKPQASRLATKIDRLVPEERKTLKKITSKITDFIGREYEAPKAETKGQIQEQSILDSLTAVFGQQQAVQTEVKIRDDAKAKIDRNIDTKRSDAQYQMLANINESTQRLSTYQDRVTQAYQRKSLELQFRSFFMQSESNQTTSKFFEIFKVQNEAIVKNTALPEFVKITGYERFKEVAKGRLFESMQSSAMGLLGVRAIGDRLKKQGSDFIKGAKYGVENFSEMLTQGVEGYEQIKEFGKIEEEMGGEAKSGYHVGGTMVGSQIMNWLAGKAGRWVRDHTEEGGPIENVVYAGAEKIKNVQGYASTVGRKKANELEMSDSFLDKVMGKILSFGIDAVKGPIAGGNIDLRETGLRGMDQPAVYNNRTQKSIIEVIPGYLSRILREVTILRTKNPDTELEVYDYGRSEFISRSTMGSRIERKLQLSAHATGQDYQVQKAMDKIFKDQKMTESQTAKARQFILDLAREGGTLSPDDIKQSAAYKKLDRKTKRAVMRSLAYSRPGDKGQHELTSAVVNVRETELNPVKALGTLLTQGGDEVRNILEERGYIHTGESGIHEIKTPAMRAMADTASAAIRASQGGTRAKGADELEVTPMGKGAFDNSAMLSAKDANMMGPASKYKKYITRGTPVSADIVKEVQLWIRHGYGPLLEDKKIIILDSTRPGVYSIDIKQYQNIVKSDIHAKRDIRSFRPGAALDAIKNTKIYNWLYKTGEGDTQRHVGPMAQDVHAKMGEQAAPGGTALDLTTMNGMSMAAIQALQERMDGMAGDHTVADILKTIKADTATLVERVGTGSGTGGQAGTGRPGVRGAVDTLISSVLDIGTKAVGSIWGAGKGTFNLMSSLGRIPKDFLMKESEDGSTRIGRAFKATLDTAATAAMRLLNFSSKVLTDYIPNGVKGALESGRKMRDFVKRHFITPIDIYVKGTATPALQANLIKAGYYIDQATGKTIETIEDIKGTVVDRSGAVILKAEDIAKGLVDQHGQEILSITTKIVRKVLSVGIDAGRRVWESGKWIWSQVSSKLTPGSLKDRFKGLAGAIGAHHEKSKEDSRQYGVLVEIRDILAGMYQSDPSYRLGGWRRKAADLKAAVTSKAGEAKAATADTAAKYQAGTLIPDIMKATSPESLAAMQKYAGKAKALGERAIHGVRSQTARPTFRQAMTQPGALLGYVANRFMPYTPPPATGRYSPVMPGSGDLLRSVMPTPAAPSTLVPPTPAATGHFRPVAAGSGALLRPVPAVVPAGRPSLRTMMTQPGALMGHVGSILPGRAGGLVTGAANRLKGMGGVKGILGKVKDVAVAGAGLAGKVMSNTKVGAVSEDTDTEHAAAGHGTTSHAQVANPAWNDRDASGRRDGAWQDRLEALKAAPKAVKAKIASLVPKYKGANIFDGLFDKLKGFMEFMSGKMGWLFSGVKNIFGSIGSKIANAGGIGSVLSKAGSAIKSAPGKILSKVGSLINATRNISGVARMASIANTARNALMVGGVLTEGVGGALLTGLGLGITAIGAILTSPVFLTGTAAAVVGYGLYKGYKYLTRNSANDFDRIRLMQYGLKGQTQYYHHFLQLEAYLQDGRVGWNADGKAYILDKKADLAEMMGLFGIDPSDQTMAPRFLEWFSERFKPFFLMHMTVMHALDKKAELSTLEDIKQELQYQYLSGISFESGPYRKSVSPLKDVDSMSTDPQDALDLIQSMSKALAKKIDRTEKESKNKASLVPPPPPKDTKAPVLPPYKPSTPPAKPNADTSEDGAAPKKSWFDGVKEGVLGGVKGVSDAVTGGAGKVATGSLPMATGGLADGSQADQYMILGPRAYLDGLNPAVAKNFRAMVQEYGHPVHVNSAYRSAALQQEVNPSVKDSMHMHGLALDVDGRDVAKLESAGLMRKYGFTRPVGGEDWHMEPAGIQGSLDQAKQDPERASLLTEASLFKGGSGYGSIPGTPKNKRNSGLAASLWAAKNEAATADAKTGKDATSITSAPLVPTAATGAGRATPGYKPYVAPNGTSASGTAPVTSAPLTGATPGYKPYVAPGSTGAPDAERRPTTPTGPSMLNLGSGGYAGSVESAAIPGSQSEEGVKKTIDEYAPKAGMDPNVMKAFAAVESDFNNKARPGSGSAQGVFQFVGRTWDEQLGIHGREYGIPADAKPTDVGPATILAAEYAKSSMRGVKSNPTATDMYSTHLMGPSGGKSFLKTLQSNPDAPLSKVGLSSSAISGNSRLLSLSDTVSQTYQKLTDNIIKKASAHGVDVSGLQGSPTSTGEMAKDITGPVSGPTVPGAAPTLSQMAPGTKPISATGPTTGYESLSSMAPGGTSDTGVADTSMDADTASEFPSAPVAPTPTATGLSIPQAPTSPPVAPVTTFGMSGPTPPKPVDSGQGFGLGALSATTETISDTLGQSLQTQGQILDVLRQMLQKLTPEQLQQVQSGTSDMGPYQGGPQTLPDAPITMQHRTRPSR